MAARGDAKIRPAADSAQKCAASLQKLVTFKDNGNMVKWSRTKVSYEFMTLLIIKKARFLIPDEYLVVPILKNVQEFSKIIELAAIM